MMKLTDIRPSAGGLTFLLLICGVFATTTLHAADHTEPPAISDMQSADIGDFYAWHSDGNLVAVMTFAGPVAPETNQSPTVHRDVLYGIHIDNDDDQEADTNIWARFGQDSDGRWGVRIDNLPGAGGPVTGAVGDELSEGSAMAWVGLREDPFFFDFTGFQDSVSNQGLTDGDGNLYFDNSRDFFAGKNITALVVEVPLSDVTGGDDVLDLWATTSIYNEGGSQ